jgi:superfamily II DNA or RNA helicase/very-short-patch-repair endonuclease
MGRNIDDIVDDRTRGIQSTGEIYHDEFLIKRPKTEWSPYIDETAKDLRAGIRISDLSLSKDDFGRQLGTYYRRGLSKTADRYADLPTVLKETVSDEKLGLLAYQLNELSYDISTSDVGIDDVQKATEAVIEKILTRHVGEDLSVSFDLSSATVSDITTQLFNNEAIASNIDLLVTEFEDSASQGLLSLLDEPQLMTPLWTHQRDALEKWWEHDKRGYVDMATATGKTVLGLSAIALQYGELHPDDQFIGGLADPADSNGSDDVLIVAHSDLILEQWRREFETHLNIPQERTTGSDDITLEWGTIHFRTPQSLVNETQIAYDLVLLDEAHHYATGSEWGALLDEFDGDVLAMSGSVDDAGSDSERIKRRLSNSIGPEIKRYSITDARADGVIPSFDWEIHYAPYDIVGNDLEKTAKRAEQSVRDFQQRLQRGDISLETDRRLRTYEDIRRFSHTKEGSSLKQQDDAFRDLVTRLFSRQTKQWNLSPLLDAVIDLVVEHYTTEKVVVLADSNAQVEELESRITDIVANPSSVYLVSGSQSRQKQRELINEFDEPESAGVLIGTGDLLGEGVDMQHASVAINMATGGVNQELVQRIGRVLRNPEDMPKHAMFYNVVGVSPTETAAIPREDGKQIIEQAAGFCSLGRRFDKLPGFALSESLDSGVVGTLLDEGAQFINSLDADGEYDWNKETIEKTDLTALHDAVQTADGDAKTVLGKWEEYAWEYSEESTEISDEEDIDDHTEDTDEESTQSKLNSSTETKRHKESPTDEDLIDEIQRLKRELDKIPTEIEMMNRGEYPVSQFENAFDSWSNAVRKAGFEPNGSQKRKYTQDDVLSGLDKVATTLGKPPSVNDINEHAPFSAAVVYNYFDSIDNARRAAGVEKLDDSENTTVTDSEDEMGHIEPNALAEYYELFRTFGSLLERLIKSERTAYREGGNDPINRWRAEIHNVVFEDGLTEQSPSYGQQQGSRNPHKMSEYRQVFGNGQIVTKYQLAETKHLDEEDAAVLINKNVIDPDEQLFCPVAPQSGVPLPIAVSSDDDLDEALALLQEFPAEPEPASSGQSKSQSAGANKLDPVSDTTTSTEVSETTTGQDDTDTEPDSGNETNSRASGQTVFWERDATPITEYEEQEVMSESSSTDGDSLDKKINEWKSQLLDLTRRNKLVSFKPTKTKDLPFEDPDPTTIADEIDNDGEILIRKRPTEDYNRNEEPDIAANEVLPKRSPNEAANSLSQIALKNKQYLRERGVDSLYLSLGMLRWYSVDHSDEANRSPLFLAPVELEDKTLRDEEKHDYVLKPKSEGLQFNPALRKKLAAEQGINLPADNALSLAQIDAAFEAVYDTLLGFDRWTIQPDVVLGIFDFTKFSLYSDLERNRDAIKNNPIIQALNGEIEPLQKAEGDITTPRASELDDVVDPIDTYQVLDADSSQQEAIEAAKRGKSFVLQGPPGTGKSQTIANIISEKLAAGERVLFVSEKQAALDVVKNRLDDVGLGRFCLEVHGEKATNTDVLGSLETELKTPQIESTDNRVKQLNKLQERRNRINQYGQKLFYSPSGWNLTTYQAFGIICKHPDVPRIDIGITQPLSVSQETLETAVDELETLARFDREINTYETSPWRHTTLKQWGVDTGDSMRQSLNRQVETVETLQNIADDLESKLDLRPESIAEFREIGQLLQHLSNRPSIAWQDAFFDGALAQESGQLKQLADLEQERKTLIDELSDHYQRSFFSANGAELNNEFAAYGVLKIIKPSYRSLKRKVTTHARDDYDPNHNQLLEDTRKLAEVQRIEERREDFQGIIQHLGPLYEAGDTDWETLIKAQRWVAELDKCKSMFTDPIIESLLQDTLPSVDQLLKRTNTVLADYDDAATFFEDAMNVEKMQVDGKSLPQAPFSALSETLRGLRDDIPALQRRVRFNVQLETVRETVCEDYVKRFLQGDYRSDYLVSAFKKRFYTKWLNSVYEQTDLGSFNADEMERYVDEFRRLDEKQQELARVEIQHEVTKRRPSSGFEHASNAKQVLVRREAEKQRKHKPLRELFDEAGSFITQLTPCFMMSPLSVAQYIKSDSIEFDTVVFDEASQIMPQDAMSSLIRADQAIIAGDTKQLPPTSFFQSDVETTEDVREDLDSILEETASVLPEKNLRWHYRSRTEELIQFSNYHYYDNSLRTFTENNPDVETGVDLEYVEDGVYDRGGSRQNEIEAQRVVDLIEEHAEERSDKSLGVVAFSSAQEQAIRDVLAEQREESPMLDAFISQDNILDEFFIKNLEMVQGDERDRMIFSVGYGPAQDGTVSTNFGPLNKSGGERRLNVAVTRAKEHITVVCSMLPGDIDLSGSNSTGAKHFKNYLEYAKKGEQALIRSDHVTETLDFDSEFEAAVYDVLDAEGYDVVSQLKSSSYSIDLAIKHPEQPGKFILGIECDGAAYHSSKTARDRDRTRQMILESLGWTIHRIWSPDWASNQEREIRKINEKVETLLED